jgi:hypothetical protein
VLLARRLACKGTAVRPPRQQQLARVCVKCRRPPCRVCLCQTPRPPPATSASSIDSLCFCLVCGVCACRLRTRAGCLVAGPRAHTHHHSPPPPTASEHGMDTHAPGLTDSPLSSPLPLCCHSQASKQASKQASHKWSSPRALRRWRRRLCYCNAPPPPPLRRRRRQQRRLGLGLPSGRAPVPSHSRGGRAAVRAAAAAGGSAVHAAVAWLLDFMRECVVGGSGVRGGAGKGRQTEKSIRLPHARHEPNLKEGGSSLPPRSWTDRSIEIEMDRSIEVEKPPSGSHPKPPSPPTPPTQQPPPPRLPPHGLHWRRRRRGHQQQ